jgi:CheY-like chemotaxis protein
MSKEKTKIYYLEDTKDHYDYFSKFLEENGYDVYPKSEDYREELNIMIDLIMSPTEDHRKKAHDTLWANHPDLLIFNMKIGGSNTGGIHAYDDLVRYDREKYGTPVIFFTAFYNLPFKLSEHMLHFYKFSWELGREARYLDMAKRLLESLKRFTKETL